ncbi:uncharacterized protein F4822DRAFT_9683 [Hypoxylon trugodes]|uniref:uncharacterized protein n=1 Tax=Hypoxylon trugodes TaxID=326681 RepID=UPI00219DD6C5|nr:uncharacterized protein F4822DRAFT_9683 [Hypoxylon trugodes]KAI1393366.1 hypothetical protein F4822DRAFT_9683 [Hypoxylon trugodes]
MEANALVMDERSDSNPDNTDSDWEIIKSDVPRHSGLAALATLIQKTPSTRVFRRPQDISLNSPNYQSRYSTQVKENVAPLAGSPDGAVIDARRSAAKSANQGQIGRRQAVPRIPNNSDVAHDGIKYPSLSATKSLPESNLASDNQRRENPENPTSNSTQVENTAEPIDGTQHRNGQEQENHRNKGKPRSNALSSVQVPLSKLERARKLTFATSDTFTAEKIEANSDEKERLREFMNFLTPSKNQHALFKRQLPLFAVTLVSINTRHASRHVLPPGTARTYICIHGSLSDADVSEVHAVLSTKKNRQRYSPWRLCFNQITITPAAASSSSEDGYYRANINSKIQTLCGAQLQIIEPQLSWLSTIGGLVEIDGRYFAITTSHKPGKPSDTDHDSLILDTLHTETLSDVDFDDDVDSAIIIRDGSNAETARIDYSNSENNKVHFNTTKQLRYSEKSPSQEEQVGPSGPQTSWCDIKTSAPTLSGVEWHLIPVKEQYQFPNILIGPNITAKENNHESAKPNPRYALKYSSCLVEADVYVKSGRSGLLKGNLLPSPSFFAIPGHETALEVWIANLEDSKSMLPWVEVNRLQTYLDILVR